MDHSFFLCSGQEKVQAPSAAPCEAALDALVRYVDGNSNRWIPAVKQVIPVVNVIDVDLVGVIPIIRPVSWPWVNHAEPVTFVLEPRIAALDHERKTGDSEAMFRSKVSPEPVIGDVVAAVSTTLLPVAMV
jgi:hypothetical protein